MKPRLVPADQARQAAAAFGPGSVPPWDKAAWTDPEADDHRPPWRSRALRPLRPLVGIAVRAVRIMLDTQDCFAPGRYRV